METASASRNANTAAFPRIHYRIASLPGDFLAFLFLIAAMNLHLLGVGSGYAWIFIPEAVSDGEWWRLVTRQHCSAKQAGGHLCRRLQTCNGADGPERHDG